MELSTRFIAAVLCFCSISAWSANAPNHFSAQDLLSGQPDGVIDNRAFQPGSAASPAHAPFNGELSISEVLMRTTPVDLQFRAVHGKDPHWFPALRLSFVTVDGDLVPGTQNILRSGFAPNGRSYWDIIVQPGRVWSEPADGGWSRAAFPFALINSLEGETHNGLAIFLYRGHEVSALRFQIVQQTLPGNVAALFTAWGQAPLRIESGEPPAAAEIARAYRAAKADAVEVRPWSDLERQVGKPALAGFADGLAAKDTVLTGVDWRGAFYLHDCDSAGGPLPWCDRARFGVWSVTKALVNEIALLRLAQKYGPEVFSAKIVDYVPAAKAYPQWAKVRFEDCINMATGVGNGTAKRDPNDIGDGFLDPSYNDWYDAMSRDEKISALLRTGHAYPWGPGEVARYRDQDMFILSVAMDGYLKSKEGPKARFWTMVEREVYEPIGIHDAPNDLTIEASGEGHPLVGFGAYPTIGDLVKIARLYHARGMWHDRQLLYSPRIDELRAGTRPRGLPTGGHSPFGETTYFNAFWQLRYDAGEGCKLYIPQMEGWGSNLVTLYPGGVTTIQIAHQPSDAAIADDPIPMARVVNRLVPFCR